MLLRTRLVLLMCQQLRLRLQLLIDGPLAALPTPVPEEREPGRPDGPPA
ncbi:hypothetical protein [Nonomuraea sp. NPDC050643]